jgi:hypothetical protein
VCLKFRNIAVTAVAMTTADQCCGSGSGRSGVILPDPDPDRHPWPADPDCDPYPFQPNVKLNNTFSRTFQYTVQNIENCDTYDAAEEDETMYTPKW